MANQTCRIKTRSSGRFLICSQAKRYIPPLWLALLAIDDAKEQRIGVFELAPGWEAKSLRENIAFLADACQGIKQFEEIGLEFSSLLEIVNASPLTIDVFQLVNDQNSNDRLSKLLDAIKRRSLECFVSAEILTVKNPATGRYENVQENPLVAFHSFMIKLCCFDESDFNSSDSDLREKLMGHIQRKTFFSGN